MLARMGMFGGRGRSLSGPIAIAVVEDSSEEPVSRMAAEQQEDDQERVVLDLSRILGGATLPHAWPLCWWRFDAPTPDWQRASEPPRMPGWRYLVMASFRLTYADAMSLEVCAMNLAYSLGK